MSVNPKRLMVWSCGLALLTLGASLTAQPPAPTQQAQTTAPAPTVPPAPPSPLQLANQAERQRIMNLLKISAIPPGAVSSSPATYVEADANPYPNSGRRTRSPRTTATFQACSRP